MNLTGKHGVGLFPERSFKRRDRDFLAIKKYLLATNSDIILLQEISDLKALREVLPSHYSFLLDPKSQYDTAGQIYTAIAFDSTRVRVSGFQIFPTGIEYEEGGKTVRTRDTLGIRINSRIGGAWVFSVHLKSSCSQKGLSKGAANSPCLLLERQLRMLKEKIEPMLAEGDPVILGGDFNRRGQPDYLTDQYLALLQPKSRNMQVVKPGARKCPTFDGKDRAPIDFFIIFGGANLAASAEELVFDQRDLDIGYKLSDHCPVIAAIRPSLP